MSIQVAIVEDDRRVQIALVDVLSTLPDCSCVGRFTNGEDAVEKIPGLSPDVVIMDIKLPGMSGVDAVGQLAGRIPGMQILMLTVFQDADTIFQALSAGAHGYLLKPVSPAQLRDAIREVHEGGSPISPSIARKVIEAFRKPFSAAARPRLSFPPSGENGSDVLSPRENEALQFLAQGCTYKEIADALGLKVPTIGTYVHRIYEKLHIRNRREVIQRFGVHA